MDPWGYFPVTSLENGLEPAIVGVLAAALRVTAIPNASVKHIHPQSPMRLDNLCATHLNDL
jgi:hypothetical protein